MPMIPKQEVEGITKTVFAMGGANSKKHKDAHAKGQERLQGKPLSYRGSTEIWKRQIGRHEDWTQALAHHLDKAEAIQLKSIVCPQCTKLHLVHGMSFKKDSICSNLKCMNCGVTASSR